jgi:RNA polymerase sigma-70 factor (ECF subfamily)
MTILAAQANPATDLGAMGARAVANLPIRDVMAELDQVADAVAARARLLTRSAAEALRPARSIRLRAASRAAADPMPATDRTDEQLLTAYLGGDREAFASLVERYRHELHGFLARFLGSSAAADDVFQETFLQVHLAGGTFDRERAFKPWLFTIAANKARDWHRRQKRRRAASIDAPVGGDADGTRMVDLMEAEAEAPSASMEATETRDRVKLVVDGMPPLYREVLQLNYFQRMSYQQIAEVLGVPLGTVKSRLHAAVATFAEAWKASEPGGAARGPRGKEFLA